MFDLNKKEKPFTSFGGFGGGGLGLSGGVTKLSTYVDDVFSTYLYTGTEGTASPTQSITTGIDNTEESLIWITARTGTTAQYVDHALFDTVRGVSNMLRSNNSGGTLVDTNSLTAFNNNGFTTGASGTTNSGTANFVAWNFKAAPGFFDVVTWTGNESNPRQIAHNLGSVPGMIIVKSLSTGNWYVYHRSLNNGSNPGNYRLRLDTPNATESGTSTFGATATSTHFTISTNCNYANNYVAYVFAHDDAQFGTGGNESIIKCGSYTGTGTGSNPTISLGFEPQWLMIKNSTSASDSYGNADWYMVDIMRGMTTDLSRPVLANSSNAESNGGRVVPTSTGFTIVNESNIDYNASGDTYIYMAIRRPNKPPELATDVFAIDTGNSSSTTPCWDSGFPVDFAIMSKPSTTYPRQVGTRLLGTKYLSANASTAEANDTDFTWDSNLGWGKTWNNLMYSWMFKRAPGFMDVVAYVGNLTTRTINHNLEAVPELVIVKNRTDTGGASWSVWTKDLTQGYALQLDTTYQALDRGGSQWNAISTFTTTHFGVGNGAATNQNNHNFIGYLFATLPGISKVGTYTGTGNAINVPCGFTNGARFILIKRTDVAGDWYVWDTLRGIASGNDPYLLLNETTTQVTNTDYIDPLGTGFTVTASAPAALNASGGTYLFLAIA